jgi:hypothetical protein
MSWLPFAAIMRLYDGCKWQPKHVTVFYNNKNIRCALMEFLFICDSYTSCTWGCQNKTSALSSVVVSIEVILNYLRNSCFSPVAVR